MFWKKKKEKNKIKQKKAKKQKIKKFERVFTSSLAVQAPSRRL
jgi:hypothetical protein